ncbi:MAG: protein kinase, partial [Promethearchaeota archaeon]
MKCPKCHHENPEDSRFCSKCATSLPSEEYNPDIQTVTLPSKSDNLIAGTMFANRYKIIEELGTGGMGKVFKALDQEISEKVALKVLKDEISYDNQMIERFRNELKFARRISHPNVCRMFDLSKEKETYFITMEYVPGENLKSILEREGPLSSGDTVSISKQICEGLAAAHRLGIVHRDLKPHNLMLDNDGNVRIMDFGVARLLTTDGLTHSGMMIGTPEYMSPEQVSSEKVDLRSDIYSLGIIMYEVVTGEVPFKGDSAISTALKHKTELPKDPRELNSQLPKELSAIILKCLKKNRDKRYKNTKELLSDLNAIEKRIPSGQKALALRKPALKSRKRNLRAVPILG